MQSSTTMLFRGVLFALLVAAPVAYRQPAIPRAAAPKAAAGGDRTITKVVKALQDMADQSKKDGDNERELYAKYKCYCDSNEAEKKAAIEKATKDIALLEADIEEIQASTGGLSEDVAQLSADMDANKMAQATAEAIREKENAAFVAEEEDLVGAIAQMKSAIETLAEVGADQTLGNAAADHEVFMGAPRDERAGLLGVTTSVRRALVAAASLAKDTKQAATVAALLQAPFTATYTAQSGQVVGILKNMRDTFTENLASARATEKAAAEAFKKLMKTLKEQYDLMFNSHEEKQGELGSNDGNLAAKKEQLEATRTQKAEDEEFLEKLKDMCAVKAKDYAKRCELRANEEVALAEAIAILNSDAAFAAFGKVAATSSGATGFVQLSSVREHRPERKLVLNMLRRAAAVHKSVMFAKLAALVEAGNPFDTVLKEIKKMIGLIDAEGKADEEQLAWCNDERTTSDKTIAEKTAEIDTLTAAIQELKTTIHDPETGLLAQIKNTEDDLSTNLENQASETKSRTEENIEYQKNIANLVETKTILKRALKVLKNYYDGVLGGAEALLQEDPAPPDTWENDSFDGQSDEGHGAIGMLEFILKNTKLEEKTAHDIESESQHSFEDSMQELKDNQATLEKTLTDLQTTLAEKEKELREKKADLKATEEDKAAVEVYLVKIKPGCDFITANIELRTTNRANEKEQMEKATELIKGTPAYKTAVAEAHVDSLGDCADICDKVGEAHVECKACLAKVSVPGYCAGHEGTEGC